MSISLIMTNDYEIMGDGRGDAESILVQPTNEILNLCGQFGVPHTLFAEILEFLKFREAERKGLLSSKFRSGSLIAEQLQQAVAAGHDVQLHLHPQWLGAKPVRDDYWKVDMEYWRIPAVPKGLGNPKDKSSLRGLFATGKKTLEDLLQPINSDYRCIAFRAGGYCIQPEAEVLTVMREQGFLVDSSVSIKRHVYNENKHYDFRASPDNLPYWLINNKVTHPSPTGHITELPIFTGKVLPTPVRRHPKTSEMIFSKEGLEKKHQNKTGLMSRIATALNFKRVNFDFCKLNAGEMIRFTKTAHRIFSEKGKTKMAPVVMTGHSKEWPGTGELSRYFEWALKKEWLSFCTISQWIQTQINNNQREDHLEDERSQSRD